MAPAPTITKAHPTASNAGTINDPIIRLEGVHKSFSGHPVLVDLTLGIETGRTTVVLGPSGCGKSVMLKHVVRLLRPDTGSVYFENHRIDHLSERAIRTVRVQIGFLFQMGALFDSMTVAENLAFPLIEHTELSKAGRADRIAEALKMVDLDGVQGKLPAELSGGQRKRVALARAIVLEPRVVLYDEPTTGLDPIRADGINELVLKLKETLGVTSIVVTHDLVSAKKVADRVVMLLGGRIIADGTFDQLQQSHDRRVQRFFEGRYDPEAEDPKPLPPDDLPEPEDPI